MTSELRPAVEVWRDAYDAYTDFYCHTTEKDPAAVIQAYGDEREAKGRAEQAAELAKFKALAETLAFSLEAGTRFMPSSATVWHREAAKALREYKEARDER